MGQEEDLVKSAIAGEPLALDRLLLLHYPRLRQRIERRTPASFRSIIAPEDVLQETFTEVYRGFGAFQPSGRDAFYRWISTIAEHRLLDMLRAQRAAKRGGGRARVAPLAQTSIAALVEIVAIDPHTPSRLAGGQEAVSAIQVALAGLREEYRLAITFRYLEGLPIAEVAQRMGKTESAVHKICSRALQALRTSMGEGAKYLSSG
jgi:RNA polymerase sigma-70 factor, ECF subfamily